MNIGHIGIAVSNLKKSQEFYDAVATTVGLKLMKASDSFVGYGDGESFQLFLHTDNVAVTNLHICFEVADHDTVNEFYEQALKHGGTDNGAPGIREDYSPTYYAAFVLDPDGNNIEAVAR